MLTAGTGEAALTTVMASIGFAGERPALLGPVGDNAVFGLERAGLVARVSLASERQRVLRELAVSRWLTERALPVTQVAEAIEQPLVHEGFVVTFWARLEGVTQGSPADIGGFLSRLHGVPIASAPSVVRDVDPFARIDERIAAATGLSETDQRFLRERLAELRAVYSALAESEPRVVVHGDPHRKNIVRDVHGIVTALDFERLGIGPAELDLVVPAVYRDLGWYGEAEYGAFVRAYGRDVREWQGYPLLSSIRRLRMTSWLVARAEHEPRVRREGQRRIASLRGRAVDHSWEPGF